MRPWSPRSNAGAAYAHRPRLDPKVAIVLALWIVLIFNPQWFLVARGAPFPIVRVQSFLPAAVLLLVIAFDLPRLKVLVPLLAYATFVFAYAQWFAAFPALADPPRKEMVVATILAIATLTIVRHPHHIRTIVLMMLLYRFAWFGLVGAPFGAVRFDPLLANQDAFGAHSAIGVVAASAVALATTNRRLRWVAAGIALLSVAGVISSFARGAFLVTAIGVAFLWIRAEGRRLAYFAFFAAIALTTIVVANAFTDVRRGRNVHESWWGEIATVTDDISDTEAEDRRLVWRIGLQVFKDNKAFGAGPDAWSTYACSEYAGLPILGEDRFGRRPDRLCGRAMHNVFVERLADLGLVGTGLFLWILIDYWRRILAIRRGTDRDDASVLRGLRTRMTATAFEVSMVALLLGGLLYNAVRISFYALVVANALFHRQWVRQQRSSGRAHERGPRGPVREPRVTTPLLTKPQRPRSIAAR